MQLIIYEPVKADVGPFVEFWSARYTDYDDDFYEANVGQELPTYAFWSGSRGRTERRSPH